tara:strand:- start:395 stop:538 length:144 start_codon:yes stop_codon:yes gene_type:complete
LKIGDLVRHSILGVGVVIALTLSDPLVYYFSSNKRLLSNRGWLEIIG